MLQAEPFSSFLSSCGPLTFAHLPSQTQALYYPKFDSLPLLHHALGMMPLLRSKRNPVPTEDQAQGGRLFRWTSKLKTLYRSVAQLVTPRTNKGQLCIQPGSALPETLRPDSSRSQVQQIDVSIPTPSLDFSASSEALNSLADTPVGETPAPCTPTLGRRLRPGSLGRKSSISRSPYKFESSS
jgi:hypothetical protein